MAKNSKKNLASISVDEWGLYLRSDPNWYLKRKKPRRSWRWVKTKCPSCGTELERLQTFLLRGHSHLCSEYILCTKCHFEELKRGKAMSSLRYEDKLNQGAGEFP